MLRLSDDGDGGVLGFGAAERWAAERRGAEGACLAEVRRHGRSGEAGDGGDGGVWGGGRLSFMALVGLDVFG